MSLFCGRCHPTRARPRITEDGLRSGMLLEQELGHTIASTLLRVSRGAARTVMLSWDLDDAWSPDTDGCDVLDYAAQPTLRATDLAVSVVPPDGWVPSSGKHGDPGARLHSGRVDGLTRFQACYPPSDGA